MDKITVLFPGGFKPLTGAHLELATRYAQHPDVQRVIMLIGPKDRDGITQQKTIDIFNLINRDAKIEMRPTPFNSPIMAAYEYLFALPEDTKGRFAMAASTKGDDYVRAKAFVPNVDKYITIGDKKGRKMPAGIDATELSIDVDPETYADGTPISATTVRQALANDDYETFRASYPQFNDAKIKNAWQTLKGIQESAIFSKDWWTNEFSLSPPFNNSGGLYKLLFRAPVITPVRVSTSRNLPISCLFHRSFTPTSMSSPKSIRLIVHLYSAVNPTAEAKHINSGTSSFMVCT